jgi:hypothetical protein
MFSPLVGDTRDPGRDGRKEPRHISIPRNGAGQPDNSALLLPMPPNTLKQPQTITETPTGPIRINIRNGRIVLFLAAIIALLAFAHLAGLGWEAFSGRTIGNSLIKKFDPGGEGNIPAWFSSSILLLSAVVLGLIAAIKRSRKESYATHWILLAFIFAFLSCDETAQIHEWTIAYVDWVARLPFTQFIGWVIPYSILLLGLAVAYLRFFLHLPNRTKVLFGVAGFIYVGGALGMELLTAAVGRVVFEGKIHFLFNLTEELLEMAGIVVFIYALLSYLGSEIHQFSIQFASSDALTSHQTSQQ